MLNIKWLPLYFLILTGSLQLQAQAPVPKDYKLFFEKAYLHTDKDLYLATDDIWFKAYLVDAQTNKPIGISNNLYVELISPKTEILQREIIHMDFGSGNGDFKLTDSIPTGKYRLRAYTNWTRNFGDNFVFEKSIEVFNPGLKAPELPKIDIAANDISVNFYPEGGSLIEGISSIVAVKAEDKMGKSQAITGAVLNATGDTITKFNTDLTGMGLFTLLPVKGQLYHAVIKQGGITLNEDIPQPLIKGLSLMVFRSDTLVNVVVNANDAALAEYMGKQLMVTGKHYGVLCLRKPIQIIGNQSILRIPQSFFPTGITDLTLYETESKPHSERLIYMENPADSIRAMLITDKPDYQPREKVTVKIKLSDTTAKVNLSMAVVDAGVTQPGTENIATYLLLQSELKGNIENAAHYFDTNNLNRFKQLDMLMLTQGWRDFVWRRVADTAIRLSYAPENGFGFSGRLRAKFADKPLANTNVVLTVMGEQEKMYLAKTDAAGKYNFSNINLVDSSQVVLAAYTDNHKKTGITLLDTIKTTNPLHVKKSATQGNSLAVNMENPEAPAYKFVSRFSKAQELKQVTIHDSKFVKLMDQTSVKFGYPDEVFNITSKDYSYENIRDYLLHESKQAKVDVESDAIFFYGDRFVKAYPRLIVNNREMPFTDDDPKEMVFDYYRNYLSISMNMVDKIVIQKLLSPVLMTLTGDQGTSLSGVGTSSMSRVSPIKPLYIIYLTLKKGALKRVDVNSATALAPGYYEARTFYKPTYNTPADQSKPDYRTTIHWEPNITTDAHGEATVSFYNADPKTKIRLVLQGVTDKGVPVVAMAGYEVK